MIKEKKGSITVVLGRFGMVIDTTADTSEFGIPTTSLPPKYSWLGANEIPTELPSGVLDMGARSYVPQLGRFLQPDPRPGGSANAYGYTFGDPINTSDPSGEYTVATPTWATEFNNQQAHASTEAAIRRAAEERAAEAAAQEAHNRAVEAAFLASGPQTPTEAKKKNGVQKKNGMKKKANMNTRCTTALLKPNTKRVSGRGSKLRKRAKAKSS